MKLNKPAILLIVLMLCFAGCSTSARISSAAITSSLAPMATTTASVTPTNIITPVPSLSHSPSPEKDSAPAIIVNRTIYSDNAVVEYNGLVYFSNNDQIYSFDGNTSKAVMDGNETPPLFFYIEDGKIIYITQYQPKILTRQINNLEDKSSENSFGKLYMDSILQYGHTKPYDISHYGTFLVAEGFAFYKGDDKKLHRVAVDGTGDTVISNIDADRLTYSNGYIYFSDQYYTNDTINVYKVKADGTNQKKLSMSPTNGYFLSEQGNLYFIKADKGLKFTYFQVDENGAEIKNIGTFSSFYSVINIDENYIYLYYCSNSGDKCALLRKPLDGAEMEPVYQPSGFIQEYGYPPVLAGDYIYFYMDAFYRIRKDGSGLQKIGPMHATVNPRV